MIRVHRLFRRAAIRCGVVVVWLAFAGSAAAAEEKWVKVAASEFTVITTLREKEAVAWTAEFSQFVAALQGFVNVNPQRLPRLTLVVFAREREYERFRPMRSDGTVIEAAGFFARRPSWAVAGLAGSRMSEETRHTIFHEGTHWFLSGFELPNPVWLEEGLAEVFSTFAIEKKNVTWGRAIDLHVQALQTLGSMPLERLLFLAQDNLHGGGDDASLRTSLAYAQSWAFVHYLIFGQRDVPKGSLLDYVARLRTAVHPDEAFRQAFGGTYADIDKKLKEYLHGGRYYVMRQPVAELPDLKAEPASVAEVEDALARLRMAAGRHDEARENVSRAIAAAPDIPRGYELQGELAQERGDLETAHGAYRTAILKGSQDYRPYFELAMAEHLGAGESDGSVRRLTPEKARAIANRYERAINLNPRFLPAYQGLAGVVEMVPAGNVHDTNFLEFGRKLFPDDGVIRLGLATVAKREGDDERARALLASVLEAPSAHPPNVIGYARRLESAWTQRDVFGQVEELAKERKFADAIALVDKQLEAGADFATRQRLQRSRDNLESALLLDQARTAMRERRWDEARAKFNAVLESNASPILKSQVRRQLEQLDKRGAKKTRVP